MWLIVFIAGRFKYLIAYLFEIYSYFIIVEIDSVAVESSSYAFPVAWRESECVAVYVRVCIFIISNIWKSLKGIW